MNALNAAIDLNASPEEVWEVLMDPQRLEDWVTIHRRLGCVSDHPLIVGSTIEQAVRTCGASFELRWTVVDLDRPHHALWEARGPAHSHASVRYELAAEGSHRTSFRYESRFALPGATLSAVASRLLGREIAQQNANRSLGRLKHLVELGSR